MSYKLILSKPKITLLLTLTGVVAYFIPSFEDIHIIDLLVFVLVGFLSSDGALMYNYYIDRDMDILMERTKNRASVGENAVSGLSILLTATIMSVAGILIAFLYFGMYTAIQLAWGNLFYVIGYSLILKRKSILNTIIGGLASPAPVWTGYAARYELLGLEGDFLGVPLIGWLLGGLVFIWTPSHTWALSTKNYEDYKAVNVPMMPVKYGLEKTGLYTFIWGQFVILYGIWIAYYISESIWFAVFVALVSVYLFWGLWRFMKEPTIKMGAKCFRVHNNWLTVVFLSLLIVKSIA